MAKRKAEEAATPTSKSSRIPHPRYSDLISNVDNFKIIESTLRGSLLINNRR